MNETASCTVQLPETGKAESLITLRPVWSMVSVFALCIGTSAWLYYEGSHDISSGSGAILSQQYTMWAMRMILAAVCGGLGLLGAGFSALAYLRKKSLDKLAERDRSWQRTVTGLQLQLTEMQMVEEQLRDLKGTAEKRVAELETNQKTLSEDLSKLKKTEKTLSQQRQALESSKNVLELHVQARTRELQKLQRRYELILNSAGEGICGLDLEGKTTFANPAVSRITGWTIEELLGKTEQEIFSFNGSDGAPSTESQHVSEQLLRRKDGEKVLVEFVRTPIKENNSVVGTVLVFKDITQRKLVEDSLAQKAAELGRSNSELEQFAFVASHDLQEPLRKIQAFGDRLKAKCEGTMPAEATDYLVRMQSASARMRNLIDDLLAFSRAIRSAEPFVHLNLTHLTREVLGDLEVRIERTGAQVHLGELPEIEADPMQMRQLMLNLIGNALKFQPPGGKPVIKIEGRVVDAITSHPMAEITVSDNGIGFDEKYIDKIFAVFQRLHGRNQYEGTGVGLAVCRRIADRHKGTITAKSAPGEGATFVISLPVHQPKPLTAAA